MALITEDGTARADAESYVSLAEATAYHAARGNAAWAALASDTLATVPRRYWFGKQGEFLPQRGSFCIRNLSWRAKALTAAEMAELSP